MSKSFNFANSLFCLTGLVVATVLGWVPGLLEKLSEFAVPPFEFSLIGHFHMTVVY